MPRTLATTSWGWHSRGGLSRQHNPSLPAYYAQKATVNGFVSPPVRGGECIQNATKFSSVCQQRAISTRSMPALAAAGGAAGDGVTFVTTEAAVRRNADPGSVSFVTGANRGIGLEVTRQLLSRTKGEGRELEWRVVFVILVSTRAPWLTTATAVVGVPPSCTRTPSHHAREMMHIDYLGRGLGPFYTTPFSPRISRISRNSVIENKIIQRKPQHIANPRNRRPPVFRAPLRFRGSAKVR